MNEATILELREKTEQLAQSIKDAPAYAPAAKVARAEELFGVLMQRLTAVENVVFKIEE